MKRYIKAAIALILLGAPAWANDPVYGTWQSETSDTGSYIIVDISGCGDKICGVITDVINGKDMSSKGKDIIKNMSADGNGKYSGGTIWAPDNDKTYKSKMTLKGDQLVVKGCVAFICRGQTWTRK